MVLDRVEELERRLRNLEAAVALLKTMSSTAQEKDSKRTEVERDGTD